MSQRQIYFGKKSYDAAAIAALPESKPTGSPGATAIPIRLKPEGALETADEILVYAEFTGGTANQHTAVVLVHLYCGAGRGAWQHTAKLDLYGPEKTAAALVDEIGGIQSFRGLGASHIELQLMSVGGAPTAVDLHVVGVEAG